MSDLISRQDAIDAIMGEPTDAHYPSWYADKIKALPSADRPTGKWENVYFGLSDDSLRFRCNICGKLSDGRHNYCPNCGARMEAKREI